MIHSSVTEETKHSHLQDFFDVYYDQFASILAANDQPIGFCLPMLKKEFYAKNVCGMLFATAVEPMDLLDSREDLDLVNDFENGIDGREGAKCVQKSPLVASYFLNVCDEIKKGVFSVMFYQNSHKKESMFHV